MSVESLIEQLPFLPEPAGQRALVILGAALAVALLTRLVFRWVVHLLTKSTDSELDDRIAAALQPPVFWSIVLGGGWLAVLATDQHELVGRLAGGAAATLVIVLWSVALLRISGLVLEVLSRNVDRVRVVQPKTLPLLDLAAKFLLAGAAVYLFCVAWGIPLTSWLASAGIIGIAVGFAARDTLANLFAGFFILADAPYQVGDYVILDDGLRGEVREIGIRSTRILTRDDVEVTVPNAVIAGGRIVNESGGPHDKMRVRVQVSVAYGSDVDEVTRVLLGCAAGAPHVVDEPAPRVRFRAFGASGLDFELLVWSERPQYRGLVLDELNRRVYRAFNEAGIEIPFAKQDVYVKELPPRREALPGRDG
ncbi:MAG: mechanosensitive ion channel family protein [Thermoanaerobaculales bacterium]|nr:mechanosensitive ion channel family protein [Thermoanaerobaculales bacterium]